MTKAQLDAAARASRLPDHAPVRADSINCYHGWAVAAPDLNGNGRYLFSYDRASNTWAAVTEGSAISCDGLDVPKDTAARLDICVPD